jgi:phospholipid/cholesterol/gamma-HCH transport system substrate-binding protein
MDENILKFRVGIFVVIALCILGILIFLNSEGWVPQYTVYVKPFTAPGVTTGTPIRKNGILIGRVKSVSSEDDHVRLELAINQDEKVYEFETVSIGTESLLGDAVIEFLPKTVETRGSPVSQNHVMGTVSIKTDAMSMVSNLGEQFAGIAPKITETLDVIQDAGKSVEATGEDIRELTNSVQGMFDDDGSEVRALLQDFRTMSQKAQVALDNFNRLFENVNNVVGDPELKSQIKKAFAELPKIFQEVRVTVSETREAVKAFGDVPAGINENLDNMKDFTAALKTNGPEILQQVNDSLENVDQFVDELRMFTKSFSKLQDSEGTIGKLLNDSEIYDAALETVERIRDVSTKIEPMVNDLRMFADSLARDPGVIGVRGALDRRPSKTGYKGNAVGREGGLFRR